MSFLPALQAVLGVVGAVNQANSGRATARRGQAYLDEAVSGSRNAYADALRAFQERKASGAYNPDALMKLLGERAAHNLGVQDKNTAASLANLGYRRGDSPFTQQSRHLSEKAGFQLRSDLMSARNASMAQEDNDRARVSSYLQNLNQLLGGQGQNLVQSGNAMSAGAYNSIAGILANSDLQDLWKNSKDKDGTTVKSNTKVNQGAQTAPTRSFVDLFNEAIKDVRPGVWGRPTSVWEGK